MISYMTKMKPEKMRNYVIAECKKTYSNSTSQLSNRLVFYACRIHPDLKDNKNQPKTSLELNQANCPRVLHGLILEVNYAFS